jgi:hypothetical protein
VFAKRLRSRGVVIRGELDFASRKYDVRSRVRIRNEFVFRHGTLFFVGRRRRARYAFESIFRDEETEKSRGVALESGGDISVHVLDAGDAGVVFRGGDFVFHEVSKGRGKVG